MKKLHSWRLKTHGMLFSLPNLCMYCSPASPTDLAGNGWIGNFRILGKQKGFGENDREYSVTLEWQEKSLGWRRAAAPTARDNTKVPVIGLHQDVAYVLWFPGKGRTFYLVCHDCAEMIKRGNTAIAFCQICRRCYSELKDWGCQARIVGQPEVFVRSTSFAIVKQNKDIPLSERILDIQPVHPRQESVWIALTHEGNLVETNLTTGTVTHLLHLPESKLDLDADVALHVAPYGQCIAIANTHEQYGVVLDLEVGHIDDGIDVPQPRAQNRDGNEERKSQEEEVNDRIAQHEKQHADVKDLVQQHKYYQHAYEIACQPYHRSEDDPLGLLALKW